MVKIIFIEHLQQKITCHVEILIDFVLRCVFVLVIEERVKECTNKWGFQQNVVILNFWFFDLGKRTTFLIIHKNMSKNLLQHIRHNLQKSKVSDWW